MESVLIVDSDPARREFLVMACLVRGIEAIAVGRIADVERWPVHQIVVADLAHLSPWWARVGAARVIALVANADEGQMALANGAAEWIERDVSAQAFAEALGHGPTAGSVLLEGSPSYAFDDGVAVSPEELFRSEADVERDRIATFADRTAPEEPTRTATPPVASSDSATRVRPHRRAGERLAAVGLIAAVVAVCSMGAYVYQRMRTAPATAQHVAVAPPAGDLVRDRGVGESDPSERLAQPPAPEQSRGIPEARAVDSGSIAAPDSASRAVPAPGTSRMPLRRAPSVASESPGASLRDASDLSGAWMMTTHVESSNVNAFEGLRLGFRMQLEQDGDRVTGRGRKVSENGRAIRRAGQTPIDVEGVRQGDRLSLTFTEAGTRRRSSGTFVLVHERDGGLRGRFVSDAARSAGTVEARRH